MAFVVLLAAAFFVVACSSDEPTATPTSAPAAADPTPTPEPTATPTPSVSSKAGGIGKFAVRRDPPANFDMMATTIWYDLNQMGAPVWGSGNLVRPCLDDVYAVCPALATEWENNADFTEWTFTLREGVQWHDGTQLTAEDLKFWLDLLFEGFGERAPAWYGNRMGEYEATTIVDPTTLKITLKEGNPLFLDVLFTPYFTIGHPRHLTLPELEAGNLEVAPLDVGLMGLGPFTFEGYDKGSIMRVRANPDYWETDEDGFPLPYMEGMDFAIMTSPDVMDAAIRTGQLDGGSPGFGYILTKPRYEQYVEDIGDDFYVVRVPSGFGTGSGGGLAWNLLKEGPWQDVRVRKAASLWIDRQESIDAVSGGFGLVGGLLNPSNPFSSSDVLTWPGWNPDTKEADRAEALRLMEEAGHADGFDVNYNCLSTGSWPNRCEFLKAQLAGLNINLELELMDAPAWTAAGQTLEYGAVQSAAGISSHLPEPNEAAFLPYSESKAAIAKHEDPNVKGYFDRLKATNDFDERVAIWQEFEQYWLLEQYYGVPIAGNLAHIPYRSWVKGRLHPPEQIMAYLDFASVWLDK
jgi:peptide/nickel transport system substrate-binding protein